MGATEAPWRPTRPKTRTRDEDQSKGLSPSTQPLGLGVACFPPEATCVV